MRDIPIGRASSRLRGYAAPARTACVAAALAGATFAIGALPAQAQTPGTRMASTHTAVDVFYAGSLVSVMGDHLGPAFQNATGDEFVGYSDGSTALATNIKNKLGPCDVFISASPVADKTLEGKANGDRINSYTTFAYSYLEIGYNTKSKFAPELKTKPWYEVVGLRGFKLGRTDPATDPKGELAVQALDGAAARYHEPALKTLATEKSDIFPENDLVGRLQAGDLDAGFFYAVEAKSASPAIPTVPVAGYTDLRATYTVAVVNGGPHPAAAQAFVKYLLGSAGTKILNQQGLTTVK